LEDKTKEIEADAIVLDLPNPNEIIEWSKRSLRVGGFMLSYVPTVNQVENLLVSLEGWKEIEIVEVIQRDWQSKSNALRPKTNMLGHTGFIISARWNG
jgi:tRNA (adenine57-N1/adenine58-N1)-methyltransferase